MGDKCLHTVDEEAFSSQDADTYQYALTALLWVVVIPLALMIILMESKDNLKFACYPLVIANIIFAFMLFILTQIILIYAIVYGENQNLRLLHIAKYGILGLSLLNNIIYKLKIAQYDVIKDNKHAKQSNDK